MSEDNKNENLEEWFDRNYPEPTTLFYTKNASLSTFYHSSQQFSGKYGSVIQNQSDFIQGQAQAHGLKNDT